MCLQQLLRVTAVTALVAMDAAVAAAAIVAAVADTANAVAVVSFTLSLSLALSHTQLKRAGFFFLLARSLARLLVR